MPWQKGQSGNPNGKPRMTPEERMAWKDLANKSLDKLRAILEAEDVSPAVVTRIAEISANRAWGMPTQSVAFEDEEGKSIPLTVNLIAGKRD